MIGRREKGTVQGVKREPSVAARKLLPYIGPPNKKDAGCNMRISYSSG